MDDRVIRQVSTIPEDQSRVVAIWGPLGKDLANVFTVRGVEIQRLDVTKTNDRGQIHRLCIFPDGREMWVNEGNIITRRRPDRFHYHRVKEAT